MNKDIELIREAADIIGAAWYMQPRHFGLLRALADRMEAQSKLHCIYVASSKNGRVKWTSDSRRGEAWLAGVEAGEYTYARRYYAEFAQILRTNYATAEKFSDVAGEGEYKNMFLAAIRDLAAINKRLNLDPDDGGAVPIIDAIDEMERDLQDCLRSMADAAARIAELKAENAQLKIKHQVACDTVATMKADREIRHKNCVSTEQYIAATTESANEFNVHHEAMLQKVVELEAELEVRKDCHDHLLDTANQLSASRDELEAQLAEYKKDAERYCFQRDADFRYFPPLCYWEDKTHNTSGKANTYEEAIDAAIAKAKP